MIITIHDTDKKKDVKVKLKVEYSLLCNDIYVVFESKDVTCGLSKGDSSPYDEYYFRKLNHIIGGSFKYETEEYFMLLGFYLENNVFIYFIIEQSSLNSFRPRFDNKEDVGNFSQRHFIFNYREYLELSEMANLEKLSFSDFIHKIINLELDINNFCLYNVKDKPNSKISNFLTYRGFSIFLDEEEKKLDI